MQDPRSSTPHGRRAAWRGPLLLALAYVVFGFTYIEISGRLVARMSEEVAGLAALERIKGFLFIVLNGFALFTAALLYRRRLERTRGALDRERERVTRSEGELHALYEALPNALLIVGVTDASGASRWRIERTNPALARLVGLDAARLAEGGVDALRRALGPDRFRELEADLVAAADSATSTVREVTVATPAVSSSWLQHVVPLTDRTGRVSSVIAVLTDTTALRAGERRLSELEDELRRSQRLLTTGELATGVAHDVNNLLTVIATHADVLRRSLDGHPELARSLEVIESAVEKASGISRSLLGFSRKFKSQPQVHALGPLVREIVELLERTLSKSHPIEVELGGADDLAVDVDRIQFQQVLLNLVLNARDSMPAGGVIGIRASELDGDRVRVTVADTGTGVPVELADRVFEPFFTTKADGRGTGLGLSLSRRIAREHGGDLSLAPRPGGGTLALFDLPLARRASDPIAPAPTGDRWVVLLESHPKVRAILSAELAGLGYTVALVDDASALADAVADPDSRPSLLIVDAATLDAGLAALDGARSRGARHPALLVSLEEPTHADLRTRAPIHVLRKPFGVAEFGRAVRKAAEHNGAHP